MYAPLLYYINYEGNSYLIAKKEIREDVFFYNLFYFLCGGSEGTAEQQSVSLAINTFRTAASPLAGCVDLRNPVSWGQTVSISR